MRYNSEKIVVLGTLERDSGNTENRDMYESWKASINFIGNACKDVLTS